MATKTSYLARGRVQISERTSNGRALGFKELPQTTSAELEFTIDERELRNYANASAPLHAMISHINGATLTVNTGDMADIVKDIIMQSGATVVAQTAMTAQTQTITVGALDAFYQLENSAGNEVRGVSNVTVADGATTYVSEVDYRVDAATGSIFIFGGATIAEGDTLTVTFDVAAKTRQVREAGKDHGKEYIVRFITDNAGSDDVENYIYTFPRMTLALSGAMTLAGEDFASATMTGRALDVPGRKLVEVETI